MRRGLLELTVGLGLLLGPLAYALTLEPEVQLVEVRSAPAAGVLDIAVLPVVQPIVPPATPEPLGPTEADHRIPFAFVTAAGIVLSDEAEAGWGTGRLRRHRGPGQFRAAKRADATKIPQSLWTQRGRTFDLYGVEGRVCTARLGDFTVLAQHDGPSLYDVFDEEGTLDFETFDANPPTPREIRRRVWDQSQAGAKWLVAEVVSDESCKGALWARDAELAAPEILHVTDEPSELTHRRIAELQVSDEYRETREYYESFFRDLSPEDREYYGTWHKNLTDHPAIVRTWEHADGTAEMVELEFGHTEGSCGDGFSTRITSLDAVRDGAFERIGHRAGATTIVDVDLDGAYEVLYAGDDDTRWLASETIEQGLEVYETFVCPC